MSKPHNDGVSGADSAALPLISVHLVLFPLEFDALVAQTVRNLDAIEKLPLQSEAEISLFHALHSLRSSLKRARGEHAR